MIASVPKSATVDMLRLEDGEIVEIEYESKIDGKDGLPPSYVVTAEQGRRWYDDAVRKYMNLRGQEFLRRWDAGEWHELYDKPGHLHLVRLAMMRSLAEQDA